MLLPIEASLCKKNAFGEEENNTIILHQFVFARVFTYINVFVCIGKSGSSIKRQLQSTNQASVMFFSDNLKEATYLKQRRFYCPVFPQLLINHSIKVAILLLLI